MNIAGYIKTSFIEWPGKISSVIFVPGCNFRCPFCHNADLVDDKVGRFSRIDEERIFADLIKRQKWVEAVVVTGGEPTLQASLNKFLSKLKQMGFLAMLHTNGTRPKVINELIIKKLTDFIAMDLKGDLENYGRFIGGIGEVRGIRETINLIVKSGVEYEFRTTVVPGLHDIKNLTLLAEEIKNVLADFSLRQIGRGLKPAKTIPPKWYLQQFRPLNCLDKKYLKVKPYSKKMMEKFCGEIREILPQTFLRGV